MRATMSSGASGSHGSSAEGSSTEGSPAEGDAESELVRRQLEVLRSTYPAWEIQVLPDGPSTGRWTAELRRAVTKQMTASGLRQRVAGPDAITLAGALAHQAALLHNGRRPGMG